MEENSTVLDMINELSRSLPPMFRNEVLSSGDVLQDYLFLVINDRLFQASRGATLEALKDSDRISFFYVTAGGTL